MVHSEGMKEGSAFTSVAKSAPFSRSLIPEKIRVEVSNIILGGHRSPGLNPSWFEFYATFLTNSRTNLSSTARWNSRLARGKTRLKMIPSFTHGPAMRRARIHKRRGDDGIATEFGHGSKMRSRQGEGLCRSGRLATSACSRAIDNRRPRPHRILNPLPLVCILSCLIVPN